MVLQWASIAPAVDAIWHILNVIDDSPVARASLVPYEDYIVGTPEGMMTGEKALSDLIESVCKLCAKINYLTNNLTASQQTLTPVYLQSLSRLHSSSYHCPKSSLGR